MAGASSGAPRRLCMRPGLARRPPLGHAPPAPRFCAASPDFQTKFGYEASKYNEDLLKLASKYIGHTYKCVSLTLELPFKDNANMPDLEVGWDGLRSMKLGEAMLQPILTSLKA